MPERPVLNKYLNSGKFREWYYLKKELIEFCRNESLSTAGSKVELTDRIGCFLDTGEKKKLAFKKKVKTDVGTITEESKIEDNFICSEKHTEFFKKKIGDSFFFPVVFQKWLKENTGKSYKDAIDIFHQISTEKKKTSIDKQFEYNIYIRDFFTDNKGRSLKKAIKCWKHKKGQQGHNQYEKSDLITLRV